MSIRRHRSLRAFAWWLPLMLGLGLLSTAEALVRHSLVLAALLVLLPVAGFVLGRLSRSESARLRRRPDDLDRAELARLRGLVAELESEAGRPVEAILASYRNIQRRYGGPR